jgi:diacylglycerol kinase (ATP)
LKRKKVLFIRNPKSGLLRTNKLIRKAIDRTFINSEFDYKFIETEYSGHARELAKEAVANNYDMVVAIGGDGTTNEIGSALLNTETVLGIIPLGSGNGLARGLNIPLSPMHAAKTLLNGRIKTIDAGIVEDQIFFINTGMGFDAVIGKTFNEQNIRGMLPYFTIGFREYTSYKPEVYILKFDGKQVAIPALFVTITNFRGWGGGTIISPDAKYDDGLLDICAIHRTSWLYILVNLYKLFTGGVVKLRKYSRYQANSVEIIRERPGPFHYDGESADGDATLNVSLLPGALKIIVPLRPKKK